VTKREDGAKAQDREQEILRKNARVTKTVRTVNHTTEFTRRESRIQIGEESRAEETLYSKLAG
jgi:hypothetical protein